MITFLSHFTPSMMPKEVIEQIFVQREDLASRLVRLVRESVLGAAKHHTLIVGPRGIGKTHLASLVYHRVQALPELTDHLRIAWLREEEWGVASFLDFLIRVLRALDEEYPDAGLAGRVEALFTVAPKVAERNAAALLDEFVGERTVFLLTENLDQLFEGLNSTGQKQFRAYLQERASWTILATAPGLFSGISLQKSPFYGFFRIKHLQELSVDEAVELLNRISELCGRDDLASYVRTPAGRARIRAVHHLAGGNHRIYVIFSEFLTRESLDDLVEPFLTTMDHLTPYYQARMQLLSPQQRKIIDQLCEVRHAVPVKEIAQRCFITQQTASAQLKQLKERGYVRAVQIGRESHYELMEPLLRLSLEVKKQRGEPVRLFIDFLRVWYTKPELEQKLLEVRAVSSMDVAYFRRALNDWDKSSLASTAHLTAWEEQCWACIEKREFGEAIELAESLVRVRGEAIDYVMRSVCLVEIGEYPAAFDSARAAISISPAESGAWLIAGIALYQMGRFAEAVEALTEATSRPAALSPTWAWLSLALGKLGRSKEAIEASETALSKDPANWHGRKAYAQVLRNLGRLTEALSMIEAHPDPTLPTPLLKEKAQILHRLGRRNEAVKALREVLLTEETATTWASLATYLLVEGALAEADSAAKRAVEMDPEDLYAWMARGAVSSQLGRHDESVSAFRTIYRKAPETEIFHDLFARVLDKASQFEEASALYQVVVRKSPADIAALARLAAVEARLERWDSSLAILGTAVKSGMSFSSGDWGASEDILESWLLNRTRTSWPVELQTLAQVYADLGASTVLSVSLAKSLGVLARPTTSPELIRAWVDTWTLIVGMRPELDFGLRLLSAGVEYHRSGDARHLLELASEERAMVESIPGIRTLAS